MAAEAPQARNKLSPKRVFAAYALSNIFGYAIGLGLSHLAIDAFMHQPIPTVSVGPVRLDDVGLAADALVNVVLTSELIQTRSRRTPPSPTAA